jgi:hypothetical protein
VSEAIARFAAFLKLSDQLLARAERDDPEECARILAVQRAHCKAKFGELPMSVTLEEVLNSGPMNDQQATWIEDALDMVVGVLGMLEQARPKQ